MSSVSAADLAELMGAISGLIGDLFVLLDSVYLGSFSLLDVMIGFEFLSVTVWFIMEFIQIQQGA